MPIIPMVGRRGWKLRLVLLMLYAVVAGGAITVLYPFALMISLGFTSEVDFDDMKVIPKYIKDDGPLYGKYVVEKWGSGSTADGRLKYPLQELSDRYGEDFLAVRDVRGWYKKDASGADTKTLSFDPNDKRVRQRFIDYNEFRAELGPNHYNTCMIGGAAMAVIPGPSIKGFGEFLQNRYRNIAAVSYAYADNYDSFGLGGMSGNVPATVADLLLRPDWWACGAADEKLKHGTLHKELLLRQADWYAYKASMKPEWRQIMAGRFDYQRALLAGVNLVPEDDIVLRKKSLKNAYGIVEENPRLITMPARLPSDPEEAKVWGDFVRKWSPRYMRATGGADLFRDYVKKRYGTIEAVNKAWGTKFASFDSPDIFPSELPMYLPEKLKPIAGLESLPPGKEKLSAGTQKAVQRTIAKYNDELYAELAPAFQRAIEWGLFVQRQLPLKYIEIIDAEQLYREFLLKKYGSLAEINNKLGTSYKTVGSILPPYRETDFFEVYDNRRELRTNYITRNFVAVTNFIALQGPAMKNTLILVVLTVGTHLTISPLAAYVLSRFRLQYTYKVLLFLIATMAFPAEVASIPSFLLMKHLHLFNTYWALILPGLANGFGIFILKSFFDSLPEELFEAARMDGAGELRQLWNVAIPLIKPILAINVLGSFTAAYGGFMWAFLVCRKESMWTLMVYLYQFQMTSGSPSLMMAALVISAMPILILFIFTQRIILRGIILPQFK